MLSRDQTMDILLLHKQGHSIRRIARDSDHSRNTVRRTVREGAPRPLHTPSRPSKLDPFKDYLRERFQEHGLSGVRLTQENPKNTLMAEPRPAILIFPKPSDVRKMPRKRKARHSDTAADWASRYSDFPRGLGAARRRPSGSDGPICWARGLLGIRVAGLPPLLSIRPSVLPVFDAGLVAYAGGEKRASRRGYQSEQERSCDPLSGD